ncbi:MAG: tetratricopeptide repeat protein, partial [bacterium]|nr:tetratricopeptide repeat protein [bacterium]
VILGAGIIFAIIKSPNIYRWGLLWFLIALLPVVNIIPIYNPFGERYLYLPFIGIAGITAYTLYLLKDKKWIWSILAVLVLGLSIRTAIRNRDWHNDYTLFSQAAKYPSGPRVYFNLANEYRKRGQVELAIQSYQQAIQRAPQFIQALHNLATLYTEQGNFPAAVSVFQQAIRVNPNSALLHNGLGMTYAQLNQLALAQNEFQHAIALQPDYSEAHHNLGIIYLKTNQIESAISEFKLAIQFQPDFLLSYDMLASIYISQNKLNDALTVLQTALQKSPERIELLQNLAKVYQQLNRVQETITIFQQILKTNPNYIPALNDLAWLYATSSDASIRNGYKAVALALQAAKLTKFSDANILDTLAAAYAETGEFTRAIEYIQQAINLTSDNNLRTQFHARLKRYHKKSPYRE